MYGILVFKGVIVIHTTGHAVRNVADYNAVRGRGTVRISSAALFP